MKLVQWIDRHQERLGCLWFMVPAIALVAVAGFTLQVLAPVVAP